MDNNDAFIYKRIGMERYVFSSRKMEDFVSVFLLLNAL